MDAATYDQLRRFDALLGGRRGADLASVTARLHRIERLLAVCASRGQDVIEAHPYDETDAKTDAARLAHIAMTQAPDGEDRSAHLDVAHAITGRWKGGHAPAGPSGGAIAANRAALALCVEDLVDTHVRDLLVADARALIGSAFEL